MIFKNEKLILLADGQYMYYNRRIFKTVISIFERRGDIFFRLKEISINYDEANRDKFTVCNKFINERIEAESINRTLNGLIFQLTEEEYLLEIVGEL